MRWLNTRPMDQEMAFISGPLAAPSGRVSAWCPQFQLSRQTAYKWLKRYQSGRSFTALEERSRRPRRSPTRITESLAQRIMELRAPDGWGARKIAQLLWEEGERVSVATVHRTLLRAGAVHRLDQHP